MYKKLKKLPILKKIVSANRALAELKGVAKSILINELSLQEAKDSSEIENIVTTHDKLYRATVNTSNVSSNTKEVQRYREVLYKGFSIVQKNKLLLKKHIVEIKHVCTLCLAVSLICQCYI